MDDVSDCEFFAHLYSELNLHNSAIDYLEKLAQINPNFNNQQRELFFTVFKNAMDPLRQSLRTITSYYEAKKSEPILSNLLYQHKEEAYRSILDIGKRGIEIIDKYLLPAEQDPSNKVFFQTSKGHFYRYVAEKNRCDECEKFLQNAKDCYSKAIEIASTTLSAADPIRLNPILCYAVLFYEIFEEVHTAISLVQNAIKEAEKESNYNSEVYQLMKQNLNFWIQAENDGIDDKPDKE